MSLPINNPPTTVLWLNKAVSAFDTSPTFRPQTQGLGDGKVRFQWQLSGGTFPDATTSVTLRGRANADAPWTFLTSLISNPANTTNGIVSFDVMPEMSVYVSATAASKVISLWAVG